MLGKALQKAALRQTNITNISELFSADTHVRPATGDIIVANGVDTLDKGAWFFTKNLDSVSQFWTGRRNQINDPTPALRGSSYLNGDDGTGTTQSAEWQYLSDGFLLKRLYFASGGDPGITFTFKNEPGFMVFFESSGTSTLFVSEAHGLETKPAVAIKLEDNISSDTGNFLSYDNGVTGRTLDLMTDAALQSNSEMDVSQATDDLFYFKNSLVPESFLLFGGNNIEVGEYTGNSSSSGPTVSCGWEPQWLLVKRVDSAGDWVLWNSLRSPTNPRQKTIELNNQSAEKDGVYLVDFTSSGFQIKSTSPVINSSGGTYFYWAIKGD